MLSTNPSAPAPPWQALAEQLRQALAQLPPAERRRLLAFLHAPPGPLAPPKQKSYPIGECVQAARRVADLLAQHPSWTRAKARGTVARELGISTVQLRRMLRHAPDTPPLD